MNSQIILSLQEKKILEDSEIKIAVTDIELDDDKGLDFYDFIKTRDLLGFIYVSEKDDEHFLTSRFSIEDFHRSSKYHFLILKSFLLEDFLKIYEELSLRLTNSSRNDLGPIDNDGVKLCRVATDYILKLDTVESDVFVRLPSGKFIRVIKKGNEISKELIDNIKNKGEKYLYQEQKEFQKIINIVFKSLKSNLKAANMTKQQKLRSQMQAVKQAQDVVRVMGISNDVIEFTDEVIKSVQEVLKSSKHLSKLIQSMMTMKSSSFVRSSILNYLLGGIVSEMGWDSINTLKKFVYASVFCDFGFTKEQEDLAKIIGTSDPRWNELASLDRSLIKSHPYISADILERGGSFLTDEITIIIQHHEKPDGSGFPRGLNYKTTPALSCAFILAYDFTQTYIRLVEEKGNDVSPTDVFAVLGEDYQKANFNKPYLALKKALNI